MNPRPLQSVTAELSSGITHNVKDEITRGEYIDLALLLQTSVSSVVAETKFTLNNEGNLVLAEKQTKVIQSVEEWSDAFLVFSSIYLAAHPQRVQEILKYFSIIRKAAKRHVGFGWLSYDIQFRLKMAVSPESMSYAVIDQELLLLCMGPAANSLNVNRKFNFRSCSRVGCSYRHGC